MKNPNPPQRSSVSTPVFLSGLAGLLAAIGSGYADYVNAPIAAPYLDGITRCIFMRVPALQHLPNDAWFATSGAVAGLGVFVIGMIGFAFFGGRPSGGSGMERQIQQRSERYREGHRAGRVR